MTLFFDRGALHETMWRLIFYSQLFDVFCNEKIRKRNIFFVSSIIKQEDIFLGRSVSVTFSER